MSFKVTAIHTLTLTLTFNWQLQNLIFSKYFAYSVQGIKQYLPSIRQVGIQLTLNVHTHFQRLYSMPYARATYSVPQSQCHKYNAAYSTLHNQCCTLAATYSMSMLQIQSQKLSAAFLPSQKFSVQHTQCRMHGFGYNNVKSYKYFR